MQTCRCRTCMLCAAILLASMLTAVHACGEHNTPAWERVLEVKGRRRSLLSFKGRRCAAT